MRVAIVASLLVCSLGTSVLGQERDDQVQLGANLVELRAVVTDSKGHLVTGLTKADFDVVDAGAPQGIEFFSEQRVNGSGDVPTVEAPGAPGAAPAKPAEPAIRTVVVFVDDFHMAPNSLANVRRALKRFVGEQLTDRDLFGLVSASGRVRMFGQFGRDRSAVLAAIDAIPLTPPAAWRGDFPPFLAAQVMLNEGGTAENPFIRRAITVIRERDRDPYSSEEAIKARAVSLSREILEQEEAWATATLDTLERLCDQLAGLPGQRLVLLYSDGFNLRDDRGVPSSTRLNAVVSHAARSGVVINGIVASGLSVDTGISAENGSRPDQSGMSMQLARGEAIDRESGPGGLAKQTGGTFYHDRNDLDALGRDVLARNATYYAIGYYAPDSAGTTYREVEVRLRNHPDLQVRAHRGYVPVERRPAAAARAKDPGTQVIDALLRPVQSTDIEVSLEFAGFVPEKDKMRMQLLARVSGGTVDIKNVGGGRHTIALDVSAVVYDLAGKPVSVQSDNMSTILTADDAEMARQGASLRYPVAVAPLKPGIYQARVAIYEASTRRVGSCGLWFVVPKK